MAGQGFKLVITKEELNRIDQADKRIEALGTEAEKVRDKVIKAFQDMIAQGVDPFRKDVSRAVKDLNGLKGAESVLKAVDDNMKKTSKSTKEAVKDLDSLLDTFSQIRKESGFNPKGGIQNLNLGQAKGELKDLKALLYNPDQQLNANESEFLRRRIELLDDYTKKAVKSQETITAEEEKESQKRIKQAEKEEKEKEKVRKEEEKAAKQAEILKNSTYEGSLAYSKAADSINKEREAIKYLIAARDNLSKSDRDYDKKVAELNRNILQHKINIDKATSASYKLKGAHRDIMNALGPLGNKLALVFSVTAISGYVKQMMNVRAEFELQNRALQALLQNKEQADALFERITALAVRSPYRVKELVTYTKQLAAYRVEQDKLYDTTKMLADVSSGLGVDMQRLILAYGQVKAANYLRGQELRQFSEAGINILGELAQYFSELEGRAISTGEVFERVSKRMVAFEDVAEVFKRITEEGGIFYNMQEIQAETLRGQISNLRDSIDIMFNDMGKANEGVLKNSVKMIRTIVEHWEELARVIRVAGGAFAIYIGYVVLAGIKQKLWTASTLEAMAAQGGLNAMIAKTIMGLKGLFSVGGIITIAIAALAIFASHLIQVRKEQNEANKAFSESMKKIYASKAAVENYTPALAELAKRQKELSEADKDDKKTQAELVDIRTKQRNILNELSEIDAQYAQRAKNKITDEQALLELAKEYNKELETRLILEGGMGVNQGYLTKEYEKADERYSQAMNNMMAHYSDFVRIAQMQVQGFEEGVSTLTKEGYEAFKIFLDPTTGTATERIIALYEALQAANLNMSKSLAGSDKIISSYIKANEDLSYAEDSMLRRFKSAAQNAFASPGIQELWNQFNNGELSPEEVAKARNSIIEQYNKVLDDSYLPTKLQAKAKDWLLTLFPGFNTWELTIDQNLSFLQSQMQKYLETHKLDDTRIFPKINYTTDTDNYFKELKNRYKELTEEAGRARIATEALSKTMSNEQVAQDLERQAEQVQAMLVAFGYTDDAKQSKQIQQFKQRLQLLQDMYKKYIELRKNFTEEEARSKVRESYGSVFKDLFGAMGWDIKNFDFTTLQGVLRQMNQLEGQAKRLGKDAQRELHDAMGDTEVQIDVKFRQDNREELQRDIADMFDGYDIAMEMESLDVPADLAQQLFGLSATSMPQMRQLLERWREEGRFVGEDGENLYKNTIEKIDDMEDKANKERLKKYITYLNDATDKRITIKREELRKLREIDSMTNVSESQKNLMREGVREEARKELDKNAWAEFKESDLYIQMFEDLEKASVKSLSVMRAQLEDMRTNLNDLDPTNVKEIVKQIDKIDEVMHNRHPLRYLNEDLRTAQQYIASKETWEKALTDAMTQAANIAKSKQEAIDFAMDWEKYYRDFNDQGREWEAAIAYGEWQRALQEVERLSDEYKEVNKQIDVYTRKLSLGQRAMQNYCTTISNICDWLNESIGLMHEFYELSLQTWGSNNESAQEYARIMAQTAQDITSLAKSVVRIYESEGADISAWIQAGQAGASIWRDINQFIDQGKIDAIKEQQRAVDELTWAYNRLEQQLDSVLALEEALVAGDQMLLNIEMRREALEAQLAAEQERKDPDEDHIQELKQQLVELGDEAEAAKSKIIEAFGGIGSSNYASEAANIVNAWVDAYKNGESTLDAVNGKFDEFIDNLVKKQAALRFGNKYLERLFTDMDDMFDQNGMISYSALNDFKDKYQNSIGGFNEGMRQLMETLGLTQGYASQNLTAMQRGIQGVTEKEAEVIESYLNTVRSNQMEILSELKRFYNMLISSETNPMLREMQNQTELLRKMNTVAQTFNNSIISVTGKAGTKALQVSMV